MSLLFQELRKRPPRQETMLQASFQNALTALWSNRLRSFLTTLGIIIGIGAVISILSLTQGAGDFIRNTIVSLGADSIIVIPGADNSRISFRPTNEQTLTNGDVQSIQHLPHVLTASPVITSRVQVVYNNQNWSTVIHGVNTEYQAIQDWQLTEGLWFSESDDLSGQSVAVLGDIVAQNLFIRAGIDPIGAKIRIQNHVFRVIGVLAPKGGGFGGFSQDDGIFVPYHAVQLQLRNSNYVDQIQLQADSTENIEDVRQAIIQQLEQNHHIPHGSPDDFNIFTSTQLLDQANQLTQLISALLIGIAAISLTVGGIGIMNIMLVSVTERTREIGIRMAVGARRQDIRNQFLIEALILCLFGGMLGMLLGLGVGWGMSIGFSLPFTVTLWMILLPFIVAGVVGILFGLYPAIRASRLDPIVALHRAK